MFWAGADRNLSANACIAQFESRLLWTVWPQQIAHWLEVEALLGVLQDPAWEAQGGRLYENAFFGIKGSRLRYSLIELVGCGTRNEEPARWKAGLKTMTEAQSVVRGLGIFQWDYIVHRLCEDSRVKGLDVEGAARQKGVEALEVDRDWLLPLHEGGDLCGVVDAFCAD